MKNLKYDYGNFPNENLGQENHFKHVFGVGRCRLRIRENMDKNGNGLE